MFQSRYTQRRTSITTLALMSTIAALIVGSVNVRGEAVPVPQKKALIGSWVETVTFPPEAGRPPLKSLVTFHADETMVCSDQGSITLEPPTVFTACHGVWKHLQGHTFGYNQVELISDLSGNLLGSLKVRGVYTVSDTGNEYAGTSFAEVLDADGNVLFSAEVTNAGERIQFDQP